jgi:hypothetical protein
VKYTEFLENYRLYTQGNETPEIIHIWCGLSALAGAAEKKLWINQQMFNLYFNLYIILVGPPGVVAKSTSMGLALKMLRECGYHTMEGSVLKEQIIAEMEALEKPSPAGFNHCSVTYVSNELNVLLSSGIEMVKFLVDIYDREERHVYKTKKSGQYEISYPYFNLISAAVPQWFGDYVTSDMGSTGFLARAIVVYEEQKRGRFPKIIYNEGQKEARAKCVEMLYAIGQMYGEVTITPEADEFYSEWYMKQKFNPTYDYRINSYLERKNKIHVLKIAGLMAIGDMRQVIDTVDLERAIYLLECTEKKMRLAYLIAGSNKLAPFMHQVMNILEKTNGMVKMTELIRILSTDLDIDDIRKLISTLQDMDEVKLVAKSGEKWLARKSQT